MVENKIKAEEVSANNVKSAADHITDKDVQKTKNIFDRLPELIVARFNDFVDAVVEKFKGYYTKEETVAAIDNKVKAIGTSDMATAIYDTDKDGTVNDSDRLGGELPSHYATAEQLAAMMPKANFEFDEATATLKITL